MRTPSEAIGSLDKLVATVDQLTDKLRGECAAITGQWTRLCELAGQRDDHAAALLEQLRPRLRDLASFAAVCERQIESM